MDDLSDHPSEDDDDENYERMGGQSIAPPVEEGTPTTQKWEAMLQKRLGETWGLCKLVTLWEMRLAIFARETHMAGDAPTIRDVQVARSATGVGGVMGNKGGLVVALTFGETTLCFVSAHLAAHGHRLATRNANLQQIVGMPELDVLSQFDHCFWMGDLNYRIDPGLLRTARPTVIEDEAEDAPAPAEAAPLSARESGESGGSGGSGDGGGVAAVAASAIELAEASSKSNNSAASLSIADAVLAAGRRVSSTAGGDASKLLKAEQKAHHAEYLKLVHELVDTEQWERLRAMDQLRMVVDRGEAFVGFQEGPIAWKPTFKMQRAAGCTYKNQRVPSYCDRVLWKSMPPLRAEVTLTEYRPVPLVSTSDHKPVLAAFTISNTKKPVLPVSLKRMTSGVREALSEGSPSPRRTSLYTGPVPYRLHLRRLQLSNILAADLAGTSDPYCVFFTSPPGLIEGGVQRTSIKWKVAGVSATGGALWGQRLGLSPPLRKDRKGESYCEWKEHELPLLKLNVNAGETLERATLIVAIFDKDRRTADDALGSVLLPLGHCVQPAPAAGPAGAASPIPASVASPGVGATASASYVLRLDEPIVFGHTLTGGGRLSCEIGVTRQMPMQRSKSTLGAAGAGGQVTAIEDSVIIETVRRREAKIPWFIIDPRTSRLLWRWDLLAGGALVFTALVTPWEVSFLRSPPTTLFVINRIVDLIFILDVILQFLMMYQDYSATEGRRWVHDPKKIAWRYMRGWFAFDVISIAPSAFDIQGYLLAGQLTNSCQPRTNELRDLYLLRIVRVLRLVKLFRLLRGARILQRWETKISLPYASLRTIQLLATVLLAMHWFACVLGLQTTFSDCPLDTWLGRFGHCWAEGDLDGDPAAIVVECASPWVVWLQCSFWAICLIAGLNVLPAHGVASAHLDEATLNAGALTDSETAVLLVLVVLGTLVWAYVLSSFVDIVFNIDPETRSFRNAIDSLNRFLSLHKLPQEDPQLTQAMREYFYKSVHMHRARAHANLYSLMSPTLQGTVVRRLGWQTKWMTQLETTLNSGRAGLFRDGDLIRIEKPDDGRSLVTHVASGTQVERQDFNAAVLHAYEHTLELTPAEEAVGASISVKLPAAAVTSDKEAQEARASQEVKAEFFNIEALSYRRSLEVFGHGTRGLALRLSNPKDLWTLGHAGDELLVTAPQLLTSLQPVEEQFLVQVAMSLSPMVFAPSELVPTGRMYVVHRGLALLRKRWLNTGAMWGLDMVLTEVYTTQYAAHAVTHLETFFIERNLLLRIAASHEHASKRLRRWTIMAALRQYLIANLVALRGATLDRETPVGDVQELAPGRPRGASLHAEWAVGGGASTPKPNYKRGASANAFSGGGDDHETGYGAGADVASLKAEVAGMRADLSKLASSMAELARRLPPPPPSTGVWNRAKRVVWGSSTEDLQAAGAAGEAKLTVRTGSEYSP